MITRTEDDMEDNRVTKTIDRLLRGIVAIVTAVLLVNAGTAAHAAPPAAAEDSPPLATADEVGILLARFNTLHGDFDDEFMNIHELISEGGWGVDCYEQMEVYILRSFNDLIRFVQPQLQTLQAHEGDPDDYGRLLNQARTELDALQTDVTFYSTPSNVEYCGFHANFPTPPAPFPTPQS